MSIRRPLQCVVLLVAAPFVAAPLAAQSVHVVDQANGPGADFTTIGAALLAASDGDALLIREGNYFFEDLVIDDMSLIIQAEAGHAVTAGNVCFTNLASDAVVVVRDIKLSGGSLTGAPALILDDCEGMVWFENVLISGEPMAFVSGGGSITNCDQVVFTRCHFEPPFNMVPAPTAKFINSRVYLFDTLIEGKDGGGFPFLSFPGEDALSMTDGLLYLVGSTICGGTGGVGVGVNGPGSDGGHALIMNGTDPVVHVLDSTVQAGAGGVGSGTGANGVDGVDFLQNAASSLVVPETGIARDHRVDSPARENGMLDVIVTGIAGDAVFVSTPSAPAVALTSPKFNGPAVVPLVPIFFFGTLPSGGSLERTFQLGTLPGGAEFMPFFSQAFLTDSRFTVGTPSFLLLLDDGI